MTFEVPLRVVDGGRRGAPDRFVALGLALGLAVVAGLAIVTARFAPAPGPARPTAAAASPDVFAISADSNQRAAAALAGTSPRAMPASVDCTSLDAAVCRRIARAAIGAIPADAPAIDHATVWGSLLCNDDLDCPGRYLADALPLGSVIVVFADDGPAAAVNVVDWRPEPGIRLGARAWLARWMPTAGGG